jgi:hypothetical protein
MKAGGAPAGLRSTSRVATAFLDVEGVRAVAPGLGRQPLVRDHFHASISAYTQNT